MFIALFKKMAFKIAIFYMQNMTVQKMTIKIVIYCIQNVALPKASYY